MSRDFAHKPRQPEGSHIPRWVWYFTSVVAIGFVGFLYYLSQVPGETGGAEAVREQLSIALTESTPKTTAPKVEPEQHETIEDLKAKAETMKKAFEFYELLENDEVSVDLPGDKPVSTTSGTTSSTASGQPSTTTSKANSWIIQVASFSNFIRVYPNPAGQFIHIDLEKPLDYVVNLNSNLGERVITVSNATQINTASLSSGAYFMEIVDKKSGHKITEQLIIQN
jgi:hypothetical protein